MEQRLQIEGRKANRSRVRMKGRIRHLNQESEGRIYNVSRTGIGIELLGRLHVAKGSHVVVQTDDIGLIEGTVRWAYGGYLGVQIDQSSNSLAQMSAYFRNFHQEVRPVLVR
ncbi:PilZ domain-containing protein [Rhizobium daejeonense]|uniref:PilZ domain-containing protein n=1 Tax=Rhizobium daejeonense TaxID=240521 RepID=A0A6M1RZ19_9HYPH|nr:PilZ domain-containing protein [Rhizobium daejeonense]NGO64309.1 PilZ domain-containing protein [Rhizobium daejeonense]